MWENSMIKGARNIVYNWLRWSERYTKTDMLYLTKGGFWLSLGHIIALLSGLAISVGLANLLPKEVYGNYKFVLSLAGILGAFSLTGMGSAITQAVARGADSTLRAGSIAHLKWNFFIVMGAITGAAYYFVNHNNILGSSLLIVGLLLPIALSSSLFGSFLIGKRDFRMNTVLNIFRTVSSATLLLIAIALTDNVIFIIAAYYVSVAFPTLYAYWLTHKKYPSSSATSDIDSGTATYAKHLSVMGIVSGIAPHIDKILVFHYLGAAQLGIYAFALAVPDQIQQSKKILGTLALPKLSQQHIPELKKALPQKALLMWGISAIVAFSYIALAPHIYALLFPQYSDSIFYSQIFALTFLFMPAVLFNQALIAHAKTKSLYIVQILIPSMRIILFLILLPPFGIWGAIATHLIMGSANTILLVYLFSRS